jgi:hypothetical protein
VDSKLYLAITQPARLWKIPELCNDPSLVPPEAGVYGWYFDQSPCDFDVSGCEACDGMRLLYVGIAPGRLGSKSNLRKRLHQHYRDRGSSTLRRTLAALLATELALVPGSGTRGRLKIGDHGENQLSGWLRDHAAVTWAVTPDPWVAEKELLSLLDLPLNLMHNARHPFSRELIRARAYARRLASAAVPSENLQAD